MKTRNTFVLRDQIRIVDFLRGNKKKFNNHLDINQLRTEIIENLSLEISNGQVRSYAELAGVEIRRKEREMGATNLLYWKLSVLASAVGVLYEELGKDMPPALQKVVDSANSPVHNNGDGDEDSDEE